MLVSNKVVPVILSGGSGTRLWPLSRASLAKQYASGIWDETLLQKTLSRVTGHAQFDRAMLIGSQKDRFILREQLDAIKSNADIVVEPARRDTFAAVVLAAEVAAQHNPDAVLAVMPSDHLIDCPDTFASAINRASKAVSKEGIAIIGIAPTEASAAYGYIVPGPAVGPDVFSVERFVEKPDVDTAAQLIADENCRWNAGIFCFRAGWLIEQVQNINPDLQSAVHESVRDGILDDGVFVPSAAFENADVISFDHGFMEKTDKALVIPSDLAWSDVGDWNSVWKTADKDENGVASFGDSVNLGSENTLVHASHRLVCTVGVSNIAVIETADTVLVLSLDDAQGVKQLVKHLEEQERAEAKDHPRTVRPWGWYQTMDLGQRFRVKRISVKPGAQLSLQRHLHRSEHWTVVRGTAEVTIGSEISKLCENESAYIPLGEIHRLRNPGLIPLELVEVQTGGYLEEDDIERLEDDFGRIEAVAPPHSLAAE